MAPSSVRYRAPGWGVGELWLDGDRPVWHESPAAKRPVREADSSASGSKSAEEGFALRRVIGETGRFPQLEARVHLPAHPLADRLTQFFAGASVRLDDVELGVEWDTPFQRALAEVLRAVPRGEVVTYGELAALAGRPGAARAAGTFCARNPLPIFLPCHRVVSSGGIGGYGSSGIQYKRRLLALEGHAAL